MTLLPHGTYKATARERQPTTQPHNHNHWDTTQPHNHNHWWRSWITRVNKEECLGPHRGCQDIGSKWYRQLKFPLREASRESSTTCSSLRDKRCDSRLGPFKARSNVVSQCNHGRLAKLRGNIHENYYKQLQQQPPKLYNRVSHNHCQCLT